ncbi:hypothetical protein HTZ77_10075 [Nonomuraea sp. SMC257]|uniref:EfeO-type cupredoxin-like domain-containing protein n=1 Tax=Nonomuraea montanisoli TaxID=2741721 RepID=A0A7Y6M238_9ACTN|nr:hypothetical protein [Nonomuraea montanisoli]NUW31772.1 hypothetical protein [Nonomuraea montanisoli]
MSHALHARRTARPAMGLATAAVTLAAFGGAVGAAPPAQATRTEAATITVTATEFHLALPSHHVKPGAYTFRLRNAGHAPHGLSVKGPKVSATSAVIMPGRSTTLPVRLRKGTYHLWCPVDRHRQHGMATTIKVG